MAYIAKERLIDFGVQLLLKKGVAGDKAAYLAQTVVMTEAFGIHTHGIVLFGYWDRTVGKEVDPAAEPEVVKEAPSTALIDGKGGFAQLALKLAKESAVEKGKANGIAMVAGRNMSWLGALGPQILSLSQAGFFAQLWAQTNTCKDCAPWGGIDAKFSTNPVALTFPTGSLPMLSDFSTAAISMGKTRAMARKGEAAPEDLFMDKDGRPAPDPGVVNEGGSILFTGGEHYGYRGYALSLWAEALTAMAGGSANNPEKPSSQCFNLTVIDPGAFASADYYYSEMNRFLAHVKNSRLRPGFDAILLPGERAQKAAQEAQSRGVFVEDATLEMLSEVADRNGIQRLGCVR